MTLCVSRPSESLSEKNGLSQDGIRSHLSRSRLFSGSGVATLRYFISAPGVKFAFLSLVGVEKLLLNGEKGSDLAIQIRVKAVSIPVYFPWSLAAGRLRVEMRVGHCQKGYPRTGCNILCRQTIHRGFACLQLGPASARQQASVGVQIDVWSPAKVAHDFSP